MKPSTVAVVVLTVAALGVAALVWWRRNAAAEMEAFAMEGRKANAALDAAFKGAAWGGSSPFSEAPRPMVTTPQTPQSPGYF